MAKKKVSMVIPHLTVSCSVSLLTRYVTPLSSCPSTKGIQVVKCSLNDRHNDQQETGRLTLACVMWYNASSVVAMCQVTFPVHG